MNPVRAKISLTVDISLPSGNLSEHFEHSFNRLDMSFNLAYNFAKNLSVTETFIVADVFRGSLSSGTILDEGTDLTERIGLVYNSVEVRESDRKMKFQGTYASSLLDFRYRNRFSDPISIGTQNSILSHVIFGRGWNLQARLSANSPIRVFDREKVGYYSLGGFDTIRGYPHGSLHAFRFAHLGTTWEREILREKELKFKLFRLQAVAHQFNLLFLLDGLALQDQLDLGSPVFFHSSLGAGFSFLITGKEGGHLHVDLSLAQPLESGYFPVFYFRSSLFSFEKKI